MKLLLMFLSILLILSGCSTNKNIINPMIETNEITDTGYELQNTGLLHKDYNIIPKRGGVLSGGGELGDDVILLTPELEQFIMVDDKGNLSIDRLYTGFRKGDTLVSGPTEKFPDGLFIKIE